MATARICIKHSIRFVWIAHQPSSSACRPWRHRIKSKWWTIRLTIRSAYRWMMKICSASEQRRQTWLFRYCSPDWRWSLIVGHIVRLMRLLRLHNQINTMRQTPVKNIYANIYWRHRLSMSHQCHPQGRCSIHCDVTSDNILSDTFTIFITMPIGFSIRRISPLEDTLTQWRANSWSNSNWKPELRNAIACWDWLVSLSPGDCWPSPIYQAVVNLTNN